MNPQASTPSHEQIFTTINAFTFAEYRGMLSNVGFSHSGMHRPEPMPQSVIVSRK
ncbi:MAG: hypothetical protein ACKVX9_11050 [Blastocatellia bacterium]